MKNTNDSRNPKIDTITSQAVTNDSCLKCPWLNRQPEGNKMLCILPGKCYMLKEWRNKE